VSGDGCSASCIIETPPGPVCGNGIVEQGEECDGTLYCEQCFDMKNTVKELIKRHGDNKKQKDYFKPGKNIFRPPQELPVT